MFRRFLSMVMLIVFMFGLSYFAAPAMAAKKRRPTKKSAKAAQPKKRRVRALPAPEIPANPIPPVPSDAIPQPVKPALVDSSRIPSFWKAGIEAGMVSGNQLGAGLFIEVPDAMGLAGPLRMGSVDWRIGGLYGQGKDGDNSKNLKTGTVFIDAILRLPLRDVDTYLGGGLNYVVNRTGQTNGTIGGEVYCGTEFRMFSIPGKEFFEFGWSVLRPGAPYASSKSLYIMTGYKMLFAM